MSCLMIASIFSRGSSFRFVAGRLPYKRKPPSPAARNAASVQSRLLPRSEEHTSELQSLMRISYAVFCLKKKKIFNPNQQVTVMVVECLCSDLQSSVRRCHLEPAIHIPVRPKY